MESQQELSELERLIAKAEKEVEKAQAECDDALAEFKQLKAAYEAEYREKHPNSSLLEVHEYLKRALKSNAENLARKEASLARKEASLARKEDNLARKEELQLLQERERLVTASQGSNINTQTVRPRVDEEFIRVHNLNLCRPKDSTKYLIHLLKRLVDVEKVPNSAAFSDNCLEYRLDRRFTSYNLDYVDNVKVALAVSGAGKTRMLLELLYSNFGYYFTAISSQTDFGSLDLFRCKNFCDSNPMKSESAIRLLYFVRVTVCNYLIEKGFKEPWQILLAQLHPFAFFGLDLFDRLYKFLLNEPYIAIEFVQPFPIVAIDRIHKYLEGPDVHPGSAKLRPFFTPLVLYSKEIFPQFLLSGTGMNFEFIKELSGSCAMKADLPTRYVVLSNFHPLSRREIEVYATQFLEDHQVEGVANVVARTLSLELCQGRPGFVSYILDIYMECKDIDMAIGKFVSAISGVYWNTFPLSIMKNHLEDDINCLQRMFCNKSLSQVLIDSVVETIWMGKAIIVVSQDEGAAAIRYGLGFANVADGIIRSIKIQELAVVECLRYLIPFADIIKGFVQRMIPSTPKPQRVGYLLEYLVAFALVSNASGPDVAKNIKASQNSLSQYLIRSDPSEVCFPDRMCGPDVVYKCSAKKTVYNVQVKFGKQMSKQEAANACDTTDPEKFYCKRIGEGELKGYEDKLRLLIGSFKALESESYSLQQMIVQIYSGEDQSCYPPGALVVTRQSHPEFFDSIGTGIWEFLDSVRSKFESE